MISWKVNFELDKLPSWIASTLSPRSSDSRTLCCARVGTALSLFVVLATLLMLFGWGVTTLFEVRLLCSL